MTLGWSLLAGIALGVLGISGQWSIWGSDDDFGKLREMWAAVCGLIILSQIYPPWAARVRRSALVCLPSIAIACVVFNQATFWQNWIMTRNIRVTEERLEDLLDSPRHLLAANEDLYVQLKRRAGEKPIIAGDPSLFDAFTARMFGLKISPQRGSNFRLSVASVGKLAALPNEKFRSSRAYIPKEVVSDYHLVNRDVPDQTEIYYAFVSSTDGAIWLVPASRLKVIGETP